jgi:hypothetical protein
LDHLDDSFKANYIGKIFKKYLLEEITYEEFNRACRIIDKALIPDLQHLVSFNEHKERNWDIPWLILVEFESLGLLRMIPPIGEATLKDHEMYQPKFFTMTPLGKFFLELEIL